MMMKVGVLLTRSQPSVGGSFLDLPLWCLMSLSVIEDERSRNSPLSGDERGSPLRYHAEVSIFCFPMYQISDIIFLVPRQPI